MFSYYHAYMPEIWQGMIKNGFIDKSSGIRLPLNIEYKKMPDRLFNNIAKKGGELWNTVKEGNLGLYVDRLSGGIYYFDYKPDLELVQQYEQLIGERFLGFQMHEWASNYLGEFKKLYNAGLDEWSEKAITDAYKSLFPDLPELMVEAMSIHELYSLYPPSTLSHLLKNIDYLFKSRCKKTGNRLITCDSYALGFDYEFKNGARNIMAEIGGQSEDVRLQLSYARGVAKAHGKTFGAYYEPWGGKPLSAVKYNIDNSEWQPEGNLKFAFSQGNENTGSTRSLQRRLYFYSYFAGADFMSEEWCANTTFYDWQDFELTPYGKIKKDFLDFTKKYDVGKPITPVAAVLPENFKFIHEIHETSNYYMNMPIYSSFADTVKTVRKGLCSLFSEAFDMKGNEFKAKPDGNRFIMINSPLPDAIDIIHEDSKNINDYKYLIDLTSDPDFSKKHTNTVKTDKVQDLLLKELPCNVEGEAGWIVTQNGDRHFVAIFNNDGVFYDGEKGEYALSECAHCVKITLKDGKKAELIYGAATLTAQKDAYYAEIPAGDLIVIEF